jgi:atypical dual specificity phosphatase
MTDPKNDQRLRIYRGNLTYLLKPEEVDLEYIVPDIASTNRTERDGESYHITIVTKSELQISDDKADIIREKYDWSKFSIIGTGIVSKGDSKAFYHIVWYPMARKIRELLKLPPKDFHITLGFEHSDVHDAVKDINTLISLNSNIIGSTEPIISDLTDDQRHQLIGLLCTHEDRRGSSFENYKLRMKIYYYLKEYDSCLELLDTIDNSKYSECDPIYVQTTKAYVYLKMNQIYNGLQILRQIPEEERDESWDSLMRDAKYRATGVADTRVKNSICIWNEDIKLSRNFSWLIPLKIAGISIPKTEDQIRAFEHANIGLIVTVMEEQSLKSSWFESTNIEYAYYAVENYGTPTIEEMDEIISKMEDSLRRDRAILVHCGGGKGRAGTVLSCFVARHGISGELQEYPQMTATDAIAYVREMRPGSVESRKQEKFISDYVNHLYKNA